MESELKRSRPDRDKRINFRSCVKQTGDQSASRESFVDAQNAHWGADYGSALLCAFVPSAPP